MFSKKRTLRSPMAQTYVRRALDRSQSLRYFAHDIGLVRSKIHGYLVSVQREPSGAGEVLRQERVDIFVGPAGGYSLECLREPPVGIDVIEAGCREQ